MTDTSILIRKNNMELYFIRHGQSEANVNKKIYVQKKDQDILLTEVGYQQATSLGKELNNRFQFSRVDYFVSPYTRALDTFSGLQKEAKDYSIFFTVNPLLREQEHPVYATEAEMIIERAKREEFSKFYYRYPNSESQADVYLRVQTFLNDLRFKKMNKEVSTTTVIVAHEVVIRMFLMILDGLSSDKAIELDIPNCEVIKRYF